jgi:nucleotide-binding universal stress UspA family protein
VFDRLVVPTLDPAAVCRDLLGGVGPESILCRAAAAGWRPAIVTDDPLLLAADAVQAASIPPEAASGAELHVVPAVASRRSAREEPNTNLARLCTAAEQLIASGRHRLIWVHATSLGVAWDAPDSFREAYIDPEDPPPPTGAKVPYLVADAATDPDAIVGIRQVFAGQLTLLDRCLARLFAALPRQDSGQEWGVLLAGVRGLPLGIHGVVGCASGAAELPWGEVVHVPAILVDPAGRMAGQRYGGLVVPADLGATLAGMVARLAAASAGSVGGPLTADVVLPDQLLEQGRDLGGLLSVWACPQRDRVVVATPEALALITPHWHCLVQRPRPPEEPTAPRLYAKPDDSFELSDVANRCSAVTEELQALAERVWAEGVSVAWSAQLSQAAGGGSGGFE